MKEAKLKNVLHRFAIILEQEKIIDNLRMKDLQRDIDGIFTNWPKQQGEREMWAILGVGGAIYGFQPNQDKAEEVRDKCWNIGKRKPEKYIVSFRKL